MPAPTYYQPIEKILNGKCEYEYYSHTTDTFDKTERTRICHVKLRETGGYNSDIAMLIFTIRNQNGAWKIHSEGVRRTDPGSMVPLRNATVKLAKEKGWKFIAVAVAPEDTPATENISQYVISIESYTYGDETVGVLTEALQHLNALGNPDFYRTKTTLGTHEYSLAFIKKEKLIDYICFFDNRVESELINAASNTIVRDEEILANNLYGMHIKLQNDALSETNPHICIGWSKMGDLSNITTREELDERYETAYPNEKVRKKAQDLGQIWRFVKEMQIGDYVVFSNGDTCHIGRIVSNYYFDNAQSANQDPDYVNIRDVEWLKKGIRKSDLSEIFQNSLGAAMSVFRLNDYKSAVNDLLNDTYVKDELLLEEIEEEDIFSGFEPWLTSPNNPDYTGKQKYGGYARAIVKLVDFMCSKNLIEDTDLNDKNIEKYISWVQIYEGSQEAKDFDVSKNSNKAGSAALKKYVKYIKYLITPHAIKFDYLTTKGTSINKIFFGTPGCGKSYHIEHEILGKDSDTKEYVGEYSKERVIRTTFYQDYSNTDFVGQILPKIVKGESGEKDIVEYIFNPGPFTLALIQAISNPAKKVALVIEEINRGNAPAIFGDIFQLLDRDENSISEYGIVNVSMIDYLNAYGFIVDGEKTRYTFSEIKIPGNMDIFATMNTSDQNVYTLDTAFVRRWDKEKIRNSFKNCTFKAMPIPGMPQYTWEEFVTSINKCIAGHLEDLQVNEDKQIGAFFVKESLLASKDAEKFAYKVFDYLWSDVAKLDHGIFFNHFDTLESLIDAYKKNGVGVFKTGIFEAKATVSVEEEENNE